VRSPEAIGEIHACPKCSSMVLIVPPADWPGHEATPAAAAALLAPRIEPAVVLSSTASTVVPAEFAFDLPTAPAVPTPSSTPESAPILDQPVAAIPAPVASGAPILIGGLSGAAVFAVAALTYVLWPSSPKHNAQSTPPVAAASTTPTQQQTNAEATTAHDNNSAADADPYAVEHSPSAPSATTNANSAEASTAETQSARPDTATPAATIAAQSTATPAPAELVKEAVAAATDTPPAPTVLTDRPDVPSSHAAAGAEHVLRFDPLDFDPEHLSLSTRPTAAATGTSTGSIPAEMPPVEAATKPAGEAKPAFAMDSLPQPEPQKAVNVKRGPVAGDDTRPLDTAQHLALKLKSFQVSEMPLARFVDTLSDLAGAPITLDPVTLELNGLSPRTPISVDASDATLESILSDTFVKQRLELAEDDGRIAAVLANAAEVRAVDFEVRDLVRDGNAAPIAKLIQQFVAPYAWRSAGGKGTIEVQGTNLHITNSLVVRREALIFCERLRLARSLPLKSKFPAALLTVDAPYHKLAATLTKPTTFTFLAWAPLGDVLRQWQEMCGVTILVDWPALREAELTPSTPVACSTINRPWTEALDGILEPLGLGWWASDAHTIQITSRDALARLERVEFYTVPKAMRDEHKSASALAAAFKSDIEENVDDQSAVANIRIELDEPSSRLIVRATPAVQRYLSAKFASGQN